MDTLDTLKDKIEQLLWIDRTRLRRDWRRLQRQSGSLDSERFRNRFDRLEHAVVRALEARNARTASIPEVQVDESLPIFEHSQAIRRALTTRQAIVVAGETGSGKSTQLPKICLQAGLGQNGYIGHTQPRRIAARSIATRLTEELDVTLGREVGFKIRFQDHSDRRTLVKLMTDGILLAETQSDPRLEQYDAIILDEAHERSLNIDFLLGYLKQLLPRRPDLRLIITSATIDAARFSHHFADDLGDAPAIEVSGRSYPVEIRYRPAVEDEDDDRDWTQGVVEAIEELASIDRGDILVFLPTERDIREMARRLRALVLPGDGVRQTQILPLYARLSAAEQNRIFQASDHRRIVLATNVAESSLTVPNVRYVVDTGTARISRYSPRSRLTRLPIEAVSQASANQRAGRCGRIAPGICIRMYDKDDFERRDAFTTPEIRRANLASVILQAKALNLGDLADFPFLDPPRPESIRDGYKTLYEIRALDRDRQLTDLGTRLARMPLDPRIGRMILAADDENALHEILIIAAVLELQDPRERPHDRQQQADERHQQFLDTDSDFVSYLKLWDFFHRLKSNLSRSKLRKACQENYLSYPRLREWTEIHRQLLQVVQDNRLSVGARRDDFGAIHRSLLAGLLSGVAFLSAPGEYTGAGGVQVSLWPGSGLVRQRHRWIVAAERVETSRRFARTAARISPNWIEPLAEHLVKRSYSDPHWHRKSNTVMAFEKVLLMGMPVVVRRRVRYGKIDPDVSRTVFLQEGLVAEKAGEFASFMKVNRRVRDEIESRAAQTRRREYVLDDYSYFDFYDRRLPPDVFDVAGLQRWMQAEPDRAGQLEMTLDDLVIVPDLNHTAEQFPDELQVGRLQLPVQYHFDPGAADDGVTVSVPREAVNQLNSQQLEWLVPGLLLEKVVAMIRSLPKSQRRNFVPVPDTAQRITAQLTFGDGPFAEVLARALSERAGEVIRPEDFRWDQLPAHLRMNVRVVDDDRKVVATGRDLADVQRELGPEPSSTDETTRGEKGPWFRDGLVTWDVESLPREVPILRGGIEILAYPMLVDRGDQVDLRLADSAERAEYETRRGVARLGLIAKRKSVRSQIRHLPRWDEVSVWASSLISTDRLKDGLALRMSELAFVGRDGIPRSRAEFEGRLDNAVERIGLAAQDLAPLLPKLFESYHRTRLAREGIGSLWAEVARDIDQQLEYLFQPGFIGDVPWNWLQQYPRFLDAVVYRVERLGSGSRTRDTDSMHVVQTHWQRYLEQHDDNERRDVVDPELVEYRWMLEELRVSLFAQPLGTSIKISPQRMEKQWQRVRKG